MCCDVFDVITCELHSEQHTLQKHSLYKDLELPGRTSALKNKNFLMRMLFKQAGCSTSLYIS